MGWEDRPYYRDRPTPQNPFVRFLHWCWNGSVPLFTAFDIRVRIHATLIITIVLTLLLSETRFLPIGWHNAATWMAILFASVMLHEFGHCFGCRRVGGTANDVLMWPLGGLATVDPPRRPGAHLVTAAAGPAVNLFLCIMAAGLSVGLGGGMSAMPLLPFQTGQLIPHYPPNDAVFYLWWIYSVNYSLLTFNLLLMFYPFDGGRIIQALLWYRVGFYRSMKFATIFGMVSASLMGVYCVVVFEPLLLMIAIFGFMACYRQRQQLIEEGAEYGDETDYSAAYEKPQPARKTKTARQLRAAKRARRIAAEHQQEQAILDAILAKVSATGMASLTWSERRTLKKATEDRRRQDVEV
jgi:Zn-dependent protease